MEDFKEYLNQSVVKARKMKRGEYNAFRGWVLTVNESADDLGWLVINKSVSNRNVAGYEGYVSWLPEEAFEEIYEEIYEEIQPAHDGFFFGEALRRLALGDCVQRRGWNGKGMHLFLVDGDAVSQALYNYLDDPDNTKNNTSVHDAIYMLTADNQLVPWLASQSDLLAQDWVAVE